MFLRGHGGMMTKSKANVIVSFDSIKLKHSQCKSQKYTMYHPS